MNRFVATSEFISETIARQKQYACIQYPVNGILRNCIQHYVFKPYNPPTNYKPYRIIIGKDFQLKMCNDSKYHRKVIKNVFITQEHEDLLKLHDSIIYNKWWEKDWW